MTTPRKTFVVVSDSAGFVGAFNCVAEARAALRPYLGIPFVYCKWPRRSGATAKAAEAAASAADVEAEDEAKDESKVEAEVEAAVEAEVKAAVEAKDEAEDEAEVEAKDEAEVKAEVEAKDEAKDEAEDEAEDVVWILPYRGNDAVACASDVKSVVESAQKALRRLDLVYGDDVKYWEAVMGTIPHTAKLRLDSVVEAMHFGSEQKSKDDEAVAKFLGVADDDDEEEPARINLLESVVPRSLDCDEGETVCAPP